jgi:hypothetical protein
MRLVKWKPYKDGNGLLWALHRLDIIRKHKRLLSAAIHSDQFGFHGYAHESFFGEIEKRRRPIELGDGAELGYIAKETWQHTKISLRPA